MFNFDSLKSIISHDEPTGKKKKHVTNSEKRVIAVGIAALLVIIALSILFAKAVNSSSALESCGSILFTAQKYSCYQALAYKSKNSSVCNYLPNSQLNACIGNIAQLTQNASLCNRINSSYQYNACIYNISYAKNDISYCSALIGLNQSYCIYRIAQEDRFNSISECNAMSNQSEKSTCTSVYDYNQAITSKTPSYCSMLPNVENSSTFSYILSSNSTNQSNYNYYEYSIHNITPQSYCYYKLATILKNQSYCNYTHGVVSQLCTESFANQSNSTENSTQIKNVTQLCTGVSNYTTELCEYAAYTAIALSEKNVSACLSIINNPLQNSCIVQLASKYNDTEICNYINNNASSQEACLESVGIYINRTT